MGKEYKGSAHTMDMQFGCEGPLGVVIFLQVSRSVSMYIL